MFQIGPLRLVPLPRYDNSTTFLSRLASRSDDNESEILKLFKYSVQQIDVFMRSHGVSIPLPDFGQDGPMLVYDNDNSINEITEGTYIYLYSKHSNLSLLYLHYNKSFKFYLHKS